jgi:hypothetical protein
MTDKSIPKNVSMYYDDWEIVKAVQKELGFRQLSAALRYALRDYVVMRETAGRPLPSLTTSDLRSLDVDD